MKIFELDTPKKYICLKLFDWSTRKETDGTKVGTLDLIKFDIDTNKQAKDKEDEN